MHPNVSVFIVYKKEKGVVIQCIVFNQLILTRWSVILLK